MILLKMIYLKIIIVPAAMDAHPPFMKVRGFICLTCKSGMYLSGGYSDYCTNCIEHMMKNDIMGKKIQNDVKFINYSSNFLRNHILKEKHDHNSHVYLMVALEGAKSTYQGF